MSRRIVIAVLLIAHGWRRRHGRNSSSSIRRTSRRPILIAERTWQHYQELRRQYETILRMSRGLGQHGGLSHSDDRASRSHDPGRWEYGRAWLQA